jgi:ribitol 2-dehydrogenase
MFTAITRTMGDTRSHRAALTLANCGAASGDVCGLGKTASPLKKRLVTLTKLKQSFNPGKESIWPTPQLGPPSADLFGLGIPLAMGYQQQSPMAQSLNGKIAIVTGASSGIGRAVAYELARHGVKQVLTARSKNRLAELAEDLESEVMVVPADMTSPKDIRSIVERTLSKFGRIDILLANAGIYISGDVIDGEPDAWDQLISTNVTGVFRLVHAVLPHLLAHRAGDILVTSSISGHQALHWEPIYSASKHAIQSFVHGLRRQLLTTGIRVGAVAPGMVLNELWGITDPAEIDKKVEHGTGLRSEDVAEAIIFMLTRPQNVTIRDLVMLPRAQDL